MDTNTYMPSYSSFSILLTELARPVKENIWVTIWITGILQLMLSLIIIPNNELVDTYWRFVFFQVYLAFCYLPMLYH